MNRQILPFLEVEVHHVRRGTHSRWWHRSPVRIPIWWRPSSESGATRSAKVRRWWSSEARRWSSGSKTSPPSKARHWAMWAVRTIHPVWTRWSSQWWASRPKILTIVWAKIRSPESKHSILPMKLISDMTSRCLRG